MLRDLGRLPSRTQGRLSLGYQEPKLVAQGGHWYCHVSVHRAGICWGSGAKACTRYMSGCRREIPGWRREKREACLIDADFHPTCQALARAVAIEPANSFSSGPSIAAHQRDRTPTSALPPLSPPRHLYPATRPSRRRKHEAAIDQRPPVLYEVLEPCRIAHPPLQPLHRSLLRASDADRN
ncbi:hypothetical protein GQ53DRAFT_760268 [Thozetella sp. PMI_491]|nr:hypothetical protein GQ53DRAFT_760268 [Thozetella sp. PMI_491]